MEGRYQKEIEEAIRELNGRPYVLRVHDSGFILLSLEAYKKLDRRQQKIFSGVDKNESKSNNRTHKKRSRRKNC